MSFLTLNGMAIPLARGGNVEPQTGGAFGRAFDGTPLSDRRYRKHRWRFQTVTLPPEDARLIEAIVDGEGDHFSFDGDAFSDKGVGLITGTAASVAIGSAADGAPVVDKFGVSSSYRGSGYLRPDTGYTNKLSGSGEADFEASISAWSNVSGGTRSIDAVKSLEGNRSMKVTTTAPGDGVDSSGHVFGAGVTPTCSIFVNPTSTTSIKLALFRDGSTAASSSISCAANTWTRMWVTAPLDAVGGTYKLRVTSNVSSRVFSVDAALLDDAATGTDGHFPWALPASPTSTHDAAYPVSLMSEAIEAITVNLWAKGLTGGPAVGAFMISAIGPSTIDNTFSLLSQSASNNLVFATFGDGGGSDLLTETAVWDGAWHMITAVLRLDPPTGRSSKELYLDGVLVASSNPGALPSPALLQDIYVGHEAGAGQWNDPLDELSISPFAWTPDYITAVFGGTVQAAQAPRLNANGDVMRNINTAVASRLLRSSYNPQGDGAGAWHKTARRVEFELLQV